MKIVIFCIIVLFQFKFVELQKIGKPCNARIMPAGLICVCNSSYCDTLEFDLPVQEGAVLIVSSSAGGARFQQAQTNFKNADRFEIPDSTLVKPSIVKNDNSEYTENTSMNSTKIFNLPIEVIIEREKQYQNITGFGGAFSGAVSVNIASLQNDFLRNSLYTSFFSNDIGIGYNMIRFSIGGSDFDLEAWAYNEKPENDIFLTNFTKLYERDLIKVSQIHTLQEVSKNFNIKLLGSAWSAPPWMKTNNAWYGYGLLKQEFYQTWADYHVRFLDLMYNASLPFWAITTGNEPIDGTVGSVVVYPFLTLGWNPLDQGKWVAFNLGPTLQKHPRLKDTKIFAIDDQRIFLNLWFHEMNKASPDVYKYISGFAFHNYWNWLGAPGTLDSMKKSYPDKILLCTESSVVDFPNLPRLPVLGDWSHGEHYINDLMDDFNHFTNGYIDWNIILNMGGGPNYVNYTLEATAITNNFEWYKQPMFYAMGHFSRFLPPGSIRVYSTQTHKLQNVAFLRPDGYVALMLYNPSLNKVHINISDKKNGIVNITVASRSLHTFLFK